MSALTCCWKGEGINWDRLWPPINCPPPKHPFLYHLLIPTTKTLILSLIRPLCSQCSMSKEEINKISSYPQLRGADSNERRNYAQKKQRNKTKRIPHKCLRIMRKMVPKCSLRSCSLHSWSKSLCMPCNNLIAGHSAEAATSFFILTLFFLSNNNLILARLQLLQTLPCRKHSAKYSFQSISQWYQSGHMRRTVLIW